MQRVRAQTFGCVDGPDVEFYEKLEVVSGCRLPLALKVKISKLIDKHCFNSGLSINMDVTSLGNVSKEFQDMFAQLMKHVCSIDMSTKELVLDLMKAIAETDPSVDVDHPPGDSSPHNVSYHMSDPPIEEINRHVPVYKEVDSGDFGFFNYG